MPSLSNGGGALPMSDSPQSDIKGRASALAAVAGATSVKILAAYQLNAAALPSNALEPDRLRLLNSRPNLLGLPMSDYGLSGVDEDAFSALTRFKPGGVVHVDPQTVVSNTVAEAYDVLPGWAGILQLIKQGALKRGKLEFVVTRPIARFPARLGARYALEGDMPVPEGDYGSLIVSRMGREGVRTRLELRRLPFAGKPGGVE